jgi:hypothetical protein
MPTPVPKLLKPEVAGDEASEVVGLRADLGAEENDERYELLGIA